MTHGGLPIPIKTKRWNDPASDDDGFRLLICRYRPRGVSKGDETWDGWDQNLAPSKELHAAYWGKTGAPIGFAAYARRYLEEMEEQRYRITGLGQQVAQGETITLLCSSACTDENQCHRTLLAKLIEDEAARAKRR